MAEDVKRLATTALPYANAAISLLLALSLWILNSMNDRVQDNTANILAHQLTHPNFALDARLSVVEAQVDDLRTQHLRENRP